jgi:hypothetical protein
MIHVRRLFLLWALFLSPLALANEVVGRALLVEGVAQVVRDGRALALTSGGQIELGDLIKVGERSSVQLRFTDSSLTALRANSELLVEDYHFTEVASDDRSAFKLLKGGLRSISGLIGKLNPAGYALHTPSATVGIRGTNLSALSCSGDCVNADGSKAADGVYGGVTEGKIVVSNSTGELELQKNEYFYVASNSTAPSRLLGPPSFLRDQLDGRSRAQDVKPVALATSSSTGGNTSDNAAGSSGASGAGLSQGQTNASTADTTITTGGNTSIGSAGASGGASGGSTTSASSAIESTTVAVEAVTLNTSIDATTSPAPTSVGSPPVAAPPLPTYTPAAAPAIQANALPINFVSNYSLVDERVGQFTGTSPCTAGNCGTFLAAISGSYPLQSFTDINLLYPPGTDPRFIQSQTEPDTIYRVSAIQYAVPTELAIGTTPGNYTFAKTASVDVGSYTTSDGEVFTWGRYQLVSVATGGTVNNNFSYTEYENWLDGPPTTTLPTSGVYTFTAVGGTHPTDQLGNAGTVINPGAWTVNFGNETLVSAAPVRWSMPSGVSYTVNVTAPQSFAATAQPASTSPGPAGGTQVFAGSTINPISILSYTSCAGRGCALTSSNISPIAGLHILGVGIVTTATITSGQEGTAQVRVYGR